MSAPVGSTPSSTPPGILSGIPSGLTKGGPPLGSESVRLRDSKGRATPRGATFGTVLAAAKPILKGAEAVADVLPGGPLIAAAIKAPGAIAKGVGGAMPMSLSSGGGAITPLTGVPSASGGAGGVGGTGAVGGAPGEQGNIESVLQDSQAFNLYYLQLQEEISAENRGYSAMSNVLKARHDTVKNAIGNLR
jgi:hypothetical protein